MSARETKHTPTPWKVRDYEANGYGDIWIDCNAFANKGKGRCLGGTVATVMASGTGKDISARSNAEFIVKAVNAHDDLVKALEAIKGHTAFCLNESCGGGTTWLRGHKEIAAIVESALAKARSAT